MCCLGRFQLEGEVLIMSYLSKLTRKEKIGILYTPFFAAGMIVSTIFVGPSVPFGGLSASSVVSSPSPFVTAPESHAAASATAQASAPITFANEDISRAELTAMQQRADEGLTNFYQWKSGESSEDRIKRITPYFSAGSPALNTSPDGSLLSDPKNASMSLVSGGSINYLKPLNGNASEYRLRASVTVSGQYNYLKNNAQNQSMILEKATTVTVVMKKTDVWQIATIEESK